MLNVAFGIRIKDTDTIGDPTRYGYFVDLNGGFSFPLGTTSVFGPTAEIGIKSVPVAAGILLGKAGDAFTDATARYFCQYPEESDDGPGRGAAL